MIEPELGGKESVSIFTNQIRKESNVKIRMKLDEDDSFVIYNGLWGFLSPAGGSINEIFV